MTIEEQIEILPAYKDGKKIEFNVAWDKGMP